VAAQPTRWWRAPTAIACSPSASGSRPKLFAAGLRARGVDAIPLLAGDAGLITDERFGAAHPLPEAMGLLARQLATTPASAGGHRLSWDARPTVG